MQKLWIVGNLTSDPETRVTQKGDKVCQFTVAVNRRKEGADFFRVTAWRQLGENCQQFLGKGRKVAVVGTVSVSAYKSSSGEARASLEVNADDVEFLTPRHGNSDFINMDKGKESGFVEVTDEQLPWE